MSADLDDYIDELINTNIEAREKGIQEVGLYNIGTDEDEESDEYCDINFGPTGQQGITTIT